MPRYSVAILAFLLTSLAPAQTVEIYPEFHRLDPFGDVVPVDRALAPRELLSPGVARNAYASFHIAVTVPANETYFLYVIPNPLTACRVSLYKEHFVQTAHGWIPDTLTEVTRLPDFGAMPDPDDHIPGQTTRLYLLDLWIPPNADIARFRLEVQLKMGDWTVRPMEVRVLPARVPEIPAADPARPLNLPSMEQSADAAAIEVVREYLSRSPLRMTAPPQTLRDIVRRNAIQDMALASSIAPAIGGPEAIERRVIELLWNNSLFFPRPFGAEWYLRLRDFLHNQFPAR